MYPDGDGGLGHRPPTRQFPLLLKAAANGIGEGWGERGSER